MWEFASHIDAGVAQMPTLHQLVAEQAARTPEAVAVESAGITLSYRELDTRANRLARYLQRLGVAPDTCIVHAVERSIGSVVSLLGILKAGGAYVPCDPSEPADRLAHIVRETAAPFVLTGSARPDVPRSTTLVVLDEHGDQIAAETDEPPGSPTRPDSLAYVIYTSGSTGAPKGVMVPQSSVVAHLRMAQQRHPLDDNDRVLHKYSTSFDASIAEVFGPLTVGARVVIAEPGGERDAAYLNSLIAARAVTVLDTVPAMLRSMIADPSWRAITSLRRVVCGGDTLASDVVSAFFESSSAALINCYGPTETCVDVTSWSCRPEPLAAPVPIGFPLPGVVVHIVDEFGNAVADERPGELLVGGPTLALGYLGQPELTAQRFIANPFGSAGASPRLYRTGDLVRTRPDGALEFLGRLDRQVKIRGFRVELGEVEAALVRHPSLAGAAVTSLETDAGYRSLVAYVVADPASFDAEAVTRDLRASHPSYLVPSQLIPVPMLPRTGGGKVDFAALPPPGMAQGRAPADDLRPGTPTEVALSRLWCRLLNVRDPGIHVSFFDLGGHSLLAAQLASEVRERFGVDLSVRTVFDRPTIARLAREIDARAADGPRVRNHAIPRAPRNEALPTSFVQETIWHLHQLSPWSLAYNFQFTLRLRGKLNVHALEDALGELVRRHEIYRTTFPATDGRPVQVVHAPDRVSLPVETIDDVPSAYRESEADRLVREECQQIFNPWELPLIRWKLLRLHADDHILVQVEHHLVHDGWSLAVELGELRALYNASCRGEPSPLPEPELQFVDFAAWQRDRLRGAVLEQEIEHWKDRLSGQPPVLEVPTDRPRPPTQGFAGARLILELPVELEARLHALAREEDATLFTALLAGFVAIMTRYSGIEDIVLGSGFGNRTGPQVQGLIGPLVNTVVLRTSSAGNPTFRELLRRARATVLDAAEHQDLPFERLVAELHPDRDLSRNPLFNVAFSSHDAHLPRLDLHGLEVALDYPDNYSAKFDINVIVTPRRAGGDATRPAEGFPLTRVEFEYNADLYDPETIRRLMAHYAALLAAVAAGPDLPVADAPILSTSERRQILDDWSGADSAPSLAGTLAQRFEQQVSAGPARIAVSDGARELTYGALNARANQVAHYLRSLGVSRQSTVGVCMDRSIDMLVALVAVIKLGAAYVPLDPGYPAERLAFIVDEAAPSVVLTTSAHRASLPSRPATCVRLDADAAIDAQPASNPGTAGSPDDPAYVMYTSGSTGKPKGVLVPQRGVLRLVVHADFCQVVESDRVAHVSNPSFDAATFEIWGALLNGAMVVIPSQDTILSASALAEHVVRHGVTVMFLTTALFNLVASARPDAFRTLRVVLFGGESADVRSVREVLRAGPPARLLHVYGPTETTTFATSHEVTEVPAGAHTIPIGRPISRTTVYVLDVRMQPVPPGVRGELYIGGEGVALGYLARPELSAERFVRNPFAGESGGVLYRTGDIVRFLPDGSLEFVGRRDNQVKVRGFRVEPGEIEATLAECDGVGDCAVVAEADGLGNRSLVAYVSERGDRRPSTETLRRFLAQRLPAYMIPARIVWLASLPLSPNGKVDRGALPASNTTRPDGTECVGPRTDAERRLAEIWQRVLSIDSVSVTADFFALGGHSLLAARLFWEIEQAFGVRLPISALFEAGTIERLAGVIEAGVVSREQRLVAMQPFGERPPIYFMHSADRYGLNYRHLARHLGPDQPSYLLLHRAPRPGDARDAGIPEMAREAAEEICRFQPAGPCFVVGHSTGGVVAFEVARVLQATGRQLGLVALLDTNCPAALRGFRPTLRRHVVALRRRSFTGKVDYVAKRVRYWRSRLRPQSPRARPAAAGSLSLQAVATYRPGPFRGRVTLFWGDEDYGDGGLDGDPRMRWQDFATDGLDVRRIPASHANMLTEPNVRMLAAELRRCIDEVLEGRSGPLPGAAARRV